LSGRTKNIYLNGAYAAEAFPHLLAKATNLSRQLRSAYDDALSKYDVLITPTLPYIATSHAAPDATPLDQIAKQVGLTSNTCQFNQTGHPALTMPIGLLEIREGPLANSGVKLPVGLQIVGKWWAEETVLRTAYAWELDNEWEKM
jgi:amidase